MKHFTVILRLSLGLLVIGLSMARLRRFTTFIGDRQMTPMYKSLVDYLQLLKPELDKMGCKALGVYVSKPEAGTFYFIQLALAPLRTVNSTALPLVLVQFADDLTRDQWLKENDRQIIIKLNGGLSLTGKRSKP